MKNQKGFVQIGSVEIVFTLLLTGAIYFLLNPPGEDKASNDELKKVNSILEQSINQPFSQEMKRVFNEVQSDGTITQNEVELIENEFERLKLKQNALKLNEPNK